MEKYAVDPNDEFERQANELVKEGEVKDIKDAREKVANNLHEEEENGK